MVEYAEEEGGDRYAYQLHLFVRANYEYTRVPNGECILYYKRSLIAESNNFDSIHLVYNGLPTTAHPFRIFKNFSPFATTFLRQFIIRGLRSNNIFF